MRSLDAPVAGMKSWGTIGGRNYYSSVDSIYLSYGRTFSGSGNYGNLNISFGKGFHVRDLNYIGSMWYAKDIRNMLDRGKQGFAIDYQSPNSINGVSFVFEMNLYDDNGKKHRATKGFLRLNVYRVFFQVDLFSEQSTFARN